MKHLDVTWRRGLKSIAMRLKVTGLVHGVYFRATMAQVAAEHNVKGWVKNLPDGSVEALLEGEDSSVKKVAEWARRGPPRARVDSFSVELIPARNLQGFKIAG
jgi:acylphosphatase